MATDLKYSSGTNTTSLSTELNSLANGAYTAAGTAYDNTPGGTNNYTHALFEVAVTFGSNATLNNTLDLYALLAPDGTNYADIPSSTNPANYAFLGSFVVRATTAHRETLGGVGSPMEIRIPPTLFKLVLRNGSGVTFPASGSTVKMLPYRYQAV